MNTNRLFFCCVCVYLHTASGDPDVYPSLENVPRRQKLRLCVGAVTGAACTELRGRQTDRCSGHPTGVTGGLGPLFAFALYNTEIPALCAPLGCWITGTTSKRQPEHVEYEFMHHNRKHGITSIQLVPSFNVMRLLKDIIYYSIIIITGWKTKKTNVKPQKRQ